MRKLINIASMLNESFGSHTNRFYYYYYGDMKLENGGMFIELPDNNNWQQDYAKVTEIVDMGSATGATNLVMINKGSIYIPPELDKRNRALSVIGATLLPNGDINDNGTLRNDTFEHWLYLVIAFHAYHGIDSEYDETYILTAPVDDSDLPDNIEIDHVLGDDETLEDYIGLSIADSFTS